MFKTSKSFENEGVWFKISPTVSFCLRRFGGSNAGRVKVAMAKYHKPFARLIQDDALPIEEVNKIMAKVVCDACLVDWKGIQIDGKDAECSFENGVKLFTTLPELFNKLFEYISGSESFKEELGNFSSGM